jgi:hypothetical protein
VYALAQKTNCFRPGLTHCAFLVVAAPGGSDRLCVVWIACLCFESTFCACDCLSGTGKDSTDEGVEELYNALARETDCVSPGLTHFTFVATARVSDRLCAL